MPNEGKSCDAIIRLLEQQIGELRADVTQSEKTGIGPPVELRLRLGKQEYAIEHTQIEPFEGQLHTGVEFARFINPVVDEISESLPGPAVYSLYFPLNTRLGVRPQEMEDVRRNFIAWIREHAERLHQNNPERPAKDRKPHGIREQYRGKPPGFPYDLTLLRETHWSHSGRHDGVLLVSRIAPARVEEDRVARLRKALDRKCPKLQRCKTAGARTVLVLEDDDIALSNHVLVGNGLAAVSKERNDLPDEIYLVETSVTPWRVWCMKRDDVLLPEEEWEEFNSAELDDITV
jgi:hypothetical protein